MSSSVANSNQPNHRQTDLVLDCIANYLLWSMSKSNLIKKRNFSTELMKALLEPSADADLSYAEFQHLTFPYYLGETRLFKIFILA